MKNILLLCCFLNTQLLCLSQQLNTSSFYDLYPVLHNPASVGSQGHALMGGSFKTQWSGMPGRPQTGLVYGQTFLPSAKIGLGGYLYRDVTGPTSRTGLQIAYAYHIPIKEKTSFSLGLEARLLQLGFDRTRLTAELGGLDPVSVNLQNRLKADAGFGIAFRSPTVQVGAAVSQLAQSKYNLYEISRTPGDQSRLYRHFYFHGAYVWKTDEDIQIIPNALFIYLPNAPIEVQSGVRVQQNELVWMGLHWRARQAWMVSAGITIKKKFSVGYSFDIYKTPLSIYHQGSAGHELILQYEWK